MAVLFPFANVGRISPIITHCADYVELFMRTYITSLTVIHLMSVNAWSYLRHVAYGFLRLSEGA